MSHAWFADQLVAAHARDAANAPAIVLGGRHLSWAALDAWVSAIAGMVGERGDVAGARVAFVAEAAPDSMAAILGILRAGAVAVPLPARLTARERAAAIDVVMPALVLEAMDVARGRAGSAADATASAADAPAPAGPGRDPEAPAVIVLTSGTTGRPKGVVLSARAMAASANAWLAALPPAEGWALPLGLAHVAGLGILWRAVAQRVPVWPVAPEDPSALLAALVATPAPSHVSLVPGQLVRLLDACRDAPPPPALRAVLLGGGAIPPALVLRAAAAGWPVVPTYGLSEMGSGVTALPSVEAAVEPGSAGYPLPGMSMAIEDPDPEGVGEILVVGDARCSGYLGEPRATQADPVRTGDLGRLDDAGRLFVVDRRVDRIVRGGENIAPAEVELVLEAQPAVGEAAVVGRQDEIWGHVPVAAIVLRDGVTDPGDTALAAHARSHLAGFKVPVAFTRLEALPRTPAGKLRRDAVRALLAGGRTGELARPGGDAIGWRVTGDGPGVVVLLHGTLSNAAQLHRLAAAIAVSGDVTVHAIDRRGSGSSRLAEPRPLDIAVHIGDLIAYLDARGIGRAALVGVSFGGVVALETAARHQDRVSGVVAYEPPYAAVAGPELLAWFRRVASDTAAAFRRGGGPAAAQTFMRAVAGDAAWERLPERARAFLEREGDGAFADAGLTGLEPDRLAGIAAPVAILTGGASEPFYTPLADAVAMRIPGARRETLPGLNHASPITEPAVVAATVRTFLEHAA